MKRHQIIERVDWLIEKEFKLWLNSTVPRWEIWLIILFALMFSKVFGVI